MAQEKESKGEGTMKENKSAKTASVAGIIQGLPLSRSYTALQGNLGQLSPAALADLRDLLGDVEAMSSRLAVTERRLQQREARLVAIDELVDIEPALPVCDGCHNAGVVFHDGLCYECEVDALEALDASCPGIPV